MRTIPWTTSVVALAIAACGGTVISTGDDQIMGQGGAAGHGGSLPDASVSKGGSPGQGGSPGLGGSPGQGGNPGLGGSPGQGGNPGVGGATGCGDLSSDPKNCGACSHDCQGGACLAGLCQPVEIGQAGVGDYVIVVDDSHLFLGSTLDYQHWAVSRMPKSGGALTELLPTTGLYLRTISPLGDSLYLLGSPGEPGTQSRAMRLAKSGGAMTILGEDEDLSPGRMSADGHSLFFSVGNLLVGFDPTNGTSSPLGELKGYPADMIAVDEAFVYAVVRDSNNIFSPSSIYRVPKSGGAVETVVAGPSLVGLFPSGGYVYYLLQADEYPYGPGSLWRIPKNGGTEVKLLDEGPSFSVFPIAFDTDDIWWIRYDADFGAKDVTVMKSPVAGGAETAVTADLVKSNIASDAKFLYWVRDSGAIMRMVR